MLDIAKKAGNLLKKKLNEQHTVEYKGEINLVTEVDHLSEKMLVSLIKRKFPRHNILTEESPAENNGSEFRWIIDPLDGTTNYAHGYPVFCVSIALEKANDICLGAVYNPMLNEMFWAEKGKGAFLNDRKLSVSGNTELSRSLLATGFPYDIRETKDNNIAYFNLMAMRVQAIRRVGAAALDLAYLAAGRFDGFWELKLMPWDTAAGWLLVKEAGGEVTDLFGRDFSLTSPHILASNGKIHQDMIRVLRQPSV